MHLYLDFEYDRKNRYFVYDINRKKIGENNLIDSHVGRAIHMKSFWMDSIVIDKCILSVLEYRR